MLQSLRNKFFAFAIVIGEVRLQTAPLFLSELQLVFPFINDGNPCWIMTAYDTEKDQIRDFALKDIIQYYDLI